MALYIVFAVYYTIQKNKSLPLVEVTSLHKRFENGYRNTYQRYKF